MRPPDATPLSSCPSCSPASCSSPAAAQAATPGVNIAGVRRRPPHRPGRATGAKYVRVFAAARRSFPAAYRRLQRHIVADARRRQRHGRRLRPHRQPPTAPTAADPGRLRGLRRRLRRPDRGRRRRRLRGLERGGRDRLLGRAPSTPAHYAAILKAAYPRDQGGRPGREGAARAADRQQLQLPRARSTPPARGGSFDAVGVHTDTACLVDPPSAFYREDGQRRALHLPGLPHGPRRDGRQRRRRQADLDDRAGLDDHDVDLRARHVGGPEALRRHRGRAGRQPHARPTTAWPAIRTSEAGLWFTLKDSTGTATSSTTTACCAPTARTSPPGTPSAASPRRATRSPGRAATSTRRRHHASAQPTTSDAVRRRR